MMIVVTWCALSVFVFLTFVMFIDRSTCYRPTYNIDD